MGDERGFVFKVCVIGDGAVGKTSLITKYTEGEFSGEYIMTLGAQFTRHDMNIDGTPIELVFWDIAGQESFSTLRKGFYKGSRGIIIVFSHEDTKHGKESFKNFPKWLADVGKNLDTGILPVIIFGNKIDLVDNFDGAKSAAEIEGMMKDYNFLGYYPTSALTGEGVNEAFEKLSEKLISIYKH